MSVTIYHNPACGTSRSTLALIREAGMAPVVIEYLRHPPSRTELRALISRMGVPVRAVLREKEKLCGELGLRDPKLDDDALLDAILAHPILLNRPIVTTKLGARLCRPPELVFEILADEPAR